MKNKKEKLKILLASSEIGQKAQMFISKKLYAILLNRLTIRILKLFK